MSEPSSDWPRIRRADALPGGRKLIVLRDAASYITALSQKGRTRPSVADRG
jgi:hypothetical protein